MTLEQLQLIERIRDLAMQPRTSAVHETMEYYWRQIYRIEAKHAEAKEAT